MSPRGEGESQVTQRLTDDVNGAFHDADGKPVTLDALCRAEPAWAANHIRRLNIQLLRWREISNQMARLIEKACPDASWTDGLGDLYDMLTSDSVE